jgi:23S rRNA (adenine2503-C2)-methyltransferase
VRDLRNLTLEETEALVEELGLPRFRADQIFRWVHGRAVASVEEMTDLAKPLRAELAEKVTISALSVDAEQQSSDGTRKLRLKTHDGRMLETVLIPDGDAGSDDDEDEEEVELPADFRPRVPKLTQCVSSQVGCALDCTFCATAKLGFGRNLTAGEIVDQVYRGMLGDRAKRPTNLVFMGMGEPLHNFGELVRALRILTDEKGAGFSRRRITVSTAGLVPGIDKLAESGLRVNLAISLNAATDEVRDELMPINKKWNIATLLEAAMRFPLERRRRVTFEYVLLAGVNDSDDDALKLARLLRNRPAKVNLIPWNPHPLSPYRRPSAERVKSFQARVREGGVPVYVRRPRGDDIDAACGQLAAKADTVQLRRP